MPIPGNTKLHRMKENVGAVANELPAEGLRQIGDALSLLDRQALLTAISRDPEHVLKALAA